MTLASLAREAVLVAVTEFDSLGRADFRREYGFSKAESYFLELNERLYDSKAIVGRALGLSLLTSQARRRHLRAREFSGNQLTATSGLDDRYTELVESELVVLRPAS
jgi:hypothetical protein